MVATDDRLLYLASASAATTSLSPTNMDRVPEKKLRSYALDRKPCLKFKKQGVMKKNVKNGSSPSSFSAY